MLGLEKRFGTGFSLSLHQRLYLQTGDIDFSLHNQAFRIKCSNMRRKRVHRPGLWPSVLAKLSGFIYLCWKRRLCSNAPTWLHSIRPHLQGLTLWHGKCIFNRHSYLLQHLKTSVCCDHVPWPEFLSCFGGRLLFLQTVVVIHTSICHVDLALTVRRRFCAALETPLLRVLLLAACLLI